MPPTDASNALSAGRGGTEVDRLRGELDAVTQRLEEEMAYQRAKLETARQQIEAQHLRQQAAEVARRRRLEDQVATLESQLREARDHGDRVQRRHDELAKQFLQQEQSTRTSVQEEVARYREAARSAWQSAEEELARMETDMQRLREALDKERSRSRQLEETLRSLQGLDGHAEEDQADALREDVETLRKALDLSERRRVQLQQRTVRLAEQLVGLQGRLSELRDRAGSQRDGAVNPQEIFRPFHSGAGNPTPVDLSEANAVLRSAAAQAKATDDSVSGDHAADPAVEDLAEEFLLISADSSLDRGKLERLQQQVEKQEAEDRARQTVQTARRNVFLDEQEMDVSARAKVAAKRPATSTEAVPAPAPHRRSIGHHLGKLASVLLTIALVLALAGIGIWFFGLELLP